MHVRGSWWICVCQMAVYSSIKVQNTPITKSWYRRPAFNHDAQKMQKGLEAAGGDLPGLNYTIHNVLQPSVRSSQLCVCDVHLVDSSRLNVSQARSPGTGGLPLTIKSRIEMILVIRQPRGPSLTVSPLWLSETGLKVSQARSPGIGRPLPTMRADEFVRGWRRSSWFKLHHSQRPPTISSLKSTLCLCDMHLDPPRLKVSQARSPGTGWLPPTIKSHIEIWIHLGSKYPKHELPVLIGRPPLKVMVIRNLDERQAEARNNPSKTSWHRRPASKIDGKNFIFLTFDLSHAHHRWLVQADLVS
ncbi:hypothetical protein C8J57DRAFT_1231599 [Mycena rebaudengoi]|nr:hypothetical protein C8J57DRAFT_1231599 [Mycena rebaudengoi]